MDRTTRLMIDVTRGNLLESRHACRAVIAHSSGGLLDTWGAIDAEVYPRSAIKPLQALPLVESGAAEAHCLSDQEVAVACARHPAGAIEKLAASPPGSGLWHLNFWARFYGPA